MLNLEHVKVAIAKRLSGVKVTTSVSQYKSDVHVEGNAIIKELCRAYRNGEMLFDDYREARQFTENVWHALAMQYDI